MTTSTLENSRDVIFRITDLPPRIAARVAVNPVTGCWEWQGSLTRKGYGQVGWNRGHYRVHRLVYSLLVEPIPDGLFIDHVKARGCESRACCWPAHLEAVTPRVNSLRGNGASGISARKTHCPKGHPYNEENTYRDAKGWRRCRICTSKDDKERKARNKVKNRQETVRVKFPPEIFEAASQMAQDNGTNLSIWIADLVTAEMKRRSVLVETAHE